MGRLIDISEVLLQIGLSSSATDEERAIVQQAIVGAEGAVQRHLRYDPLRMERTEFYPRQDLSSSNRGVWEANDTEAYFRQVAEAATCELQLQCIPVRSVAHLYVDYDGRSGTRAGAFDATTEKTEGSDFWANYDMLDSSGAKLCRDGILRSEGTWPTTAGSVKVVYTAGYSLKEIHGQDSVVDASPIMEVVIDEAVRRAKKVLAMMKSTTGWAAGAKTSESLGEYSYSVDGGSLTQLTSGGSLTPSNLSRLAEFVNWGII